MAFAEKTLASPKSQPPPLSLPHYFWDFWDFIPMLKLRSHQLPTLDSTYSLSLIYCSSPTLPPCVSIYVCFDLLCSPLHLYYPQSLHFLHFQYPQTMLCSLTPYIRLSALYDIVHVWILTLIINSLSTQPCSEPLNPWTSVSRPPEIILVTSRALDLFMTSMLTSLD